MAKRRPALTPQLQNDVCAFIRQGTFPDVAAEAAGIPQATFRKWLARGERAHAPESLRTLVAEVRQATAQARALAEMAAVKKDPMAWLKCGPGKETAVLPGWTVPVRPPRVDERRQGSGPDPALADLCCALLQLLTPYPEVRTVVAAALTGLQPRSDSGT